MSAQSVGLQGYLKHDDDDDAAKWARYLAIIVVLSQLLRPSPCEKKCSSFAVGGTKQGTLALVKWKSDVLPLRCVPIMKIRGRHLDCNGVAVAAGGGVRHL